MTNKEAIAFFNKAHSFAASGRALQKDKVDAVFPDAVVRFLYMHAIELYLKAFLLSKGETLEHLKSWNVGHKYSVLCEMANERGLSMSNKTRNGIGQIQDSGMAMDARYVRLGWGTVLTLSFLDSACVELHEASEVSVFEESDIK